MTSPIVAVIDRIAADFEALSPPDRPESPYRRLRARLPQDYARQFTFSPPERRETVGQNSSGTMVIWEVSVLIVIDGTGRDFESRSKAGANETNLLARAIEKRTVWPANVFEVLLDDNELDIDDETQDIQTTLTLRVLCMETD